jgi:hypothetical protein
MKKWKLLPQITSVYYMTILTIGMKHFHLYFLGVKYKVPIGFLTVE